VNAEALHDALTCAAEAVIAGEVGETREQETALFEARLAASGAFPIGSREAEALGIILEAAGRVAEAAE
jgi:hypothetical protein